MTTPAARLVARLTDTGQTVAVAESLTGGLCRTIIEAPVDGVAIAAAKRAILDGIAVALAGLDHESAPVVADHVAALGGAPRSSVLGRGFMTSPVFSGLWNVAFKRAAETGS